MVSLLRRLKNTLLLAVLGFAAVFAGAALLGAPLDELAGSMLVVGGGVALVVGVPFTAVYLDYL